MFRYVFLFLLLSTSLSHAQVRLEVVPDRLEVGEIFTVKVTAQDLPSVYGMDLALRYPPTLASPLDADPARSGFQAAPSPLWGDKAFVAANRFEQRDGLHTLVLARLAPAEPVSGDGVLWQGDFRADQAGEAAFKLERVEFGTREGEKVIPELSRAEASIQLYANSPPTDEESAGDGDEDKSFEITWTQIALGAAGLLILVLLVIIWRLSRAPKP